MSKFYQFCFARLGGNAADAGWQSLNKSSDIPQDVGALAERIAKGNHIAESEKAPKDVVMHQIFTDPQKDGIGVSRVYYSGVDPFGRALYFNHAYLFENTYEILKDPNSILGIESSNFRFTAEETANIPESLVYSAPIDDFKALEECGMNAESYITYVKAIYRIFYEGNASITIYVKTDGSEKMAKNLLYLAYSALPYSLRHRITAETYAKPKASAGCSFVFTGAVPERVKYIDPVTGENNVIDAGLEDWLVKNSFALYYVKAFPKSVELKEAYYNKLEQILTKIGFTKTENAQLINLAFRASTTKLSMLDDSALVAYFNEWLSLNLPLNDYIIEKLNALLAEVTERDLVINDVLTAKIVDKISQSSSEKLTDTYLKYLNSYVGKLTADEAYKFMLIQKKDASLFDKLCAKLRESEIGLDILMDYYLREARILAAREDINYNNLSYFLSLVPEHPVKQSIRQVFAPKCEKIALAKQQSGANFEAVYEEYKSEFLKICSGITISYSALNSDYDRNFRCAFVPERIEEYIRYYRIFSNASSFKASCEFVEAAKAVTSRDYAAIKTYLHFGCTFNDAARPSAEETKQFADNLFRYAVYCGLPNDCSDFAMWVRFANALEKDLYELLLDANVAVIVNPEAMQESVSNDPFWDKLNGKGISNIEQFFDDAVKYINDHSDGETIDKKVMDVLRNAIKERKKNAKEEQKEQRKAEKEQRKAEKEQLKAEKAQNAQNAVADGEKKKGGFFSNFFGGKKKKNEVDDPYGVSGDFDDLSDK